MNIGKQQEETDVPGSQMLLENERLKRLNVPALHICPSQSTQQLLPAHRACSCSLQFEFGGPEIGLGKLTWLSSATQVG